MPTPDVHRLSTCTIHPHPTLARSPPKRCHLTPWDIPLLSVRYIQKGLLFPKPDSSDGLDEADELMITLIQRLKSSLSHTLSHFSPLAGRLVFQNQTPTSSHIYIDCNDAGVEFIHAIAHMSLAELLTPLDLHSIFASFFPLTGDVNIDGISKPLFAVQLTELTDGFFLGCAFNHTVGDGSAFWHFFNAWAEMCRSGNISRSPVLDRWFPSEIQPPISLPFSRPEEVTERIPLPPLRDRFFHFSPQSVARLKAKANAECGTDKISSFQALSAHMWRCITRARNIPPDENTFCQLSIDNRSRMEPQLPRDYFGNCILDVTATVSAGDLVDNGLGWAAQRVHEMVAEHGDAVARSKYEAMARKPIVHRFSAMGKWSVSIGSSPRFDVYGVDFGRGSAVGVRTGWDNKFDGKITAFPGKYGGGNVDLELCLPADVMNSLETDEEFMALAS